MNKAEQLIIENRLNQSLLEITNHLERVSNAAKPVELDQNRVGRLSRMDAMQGQAMALASHQREQQKIKLIEQALLRLQHGQYGECTQCGDAITVARLEFDPAAQYCLQCAESIEARRVE